MVRGQQVNRVEKEIRVVALHVLDRGEAYSAEVWIAWGLCGGDQNKRSGMRKVQRVLHSMENEGLIVGREVLPAEHKGSQQVRRYYKPKEKDV